LRESSCFYGLPVKTPEFKPSSTWIPDTAS
jgi:hypothetical protein